MNNPIEIASSQSGELCQVRLPSGRIITLKGIEPVMISAADMKAPEPMAILRERYDDFENGSEAYADILQRVHQHGYQAGKFVELHNTTLDIADLTKAIPLSNKNYWAWAFVEALERVSPGYENPGIAWKLRPNWGKKLEKEGGKFCYTYQEIMAPQIPQIITMLKKKLQREAVISVWDQTHLLQRSNLLRVPCTLALHFYRDPISNSVNMHCSMRSSDICNLLSFDLFHHSFLCQYICAKAGLQPGSLHFHSSHSYIHQKRGKPEKLARELAGLNSREYPKNLTLEIENLDTAIRSALNVIKESLEGNIPERKVDLGNDYISAMTNAVLYKISRKAKRFYSDHIFTELV